MIKRSDMRRNWTHRCSSSHCPQNCSNSSNPHRNNRHCYSYRRQGRPQGAGTPPDTAPYIPIFIFLKTTTPPNGGNSGGVPPPFLPLAAYAAIGCSKKTHRCSSTHCPQKSSNPSNPHRNKRHRYRNRRQGRPQLFRRSTKNSHMCMCYCCHLSN